MDASKFSLSEAKELLQPHFNDLPFRRLADYLKPTDVVVDTLSYRLTTLAIDLTIPATMSLETKVFAVFSRHRREGTKIIGEQLFLVHGTENHTPWMFCRTVLIQLGKDFATAFVSESAEMKQVRDEFVLPVSLDDGFATECWITIGKWIGQSIERREKTNTSLAVIREECVQRAGAARAFEALY